MTHRAKYGRRFGRRFGAVVGLVGTLAALVAWPLTMDGGVAMAQPVDVEAPELTPNDGWLNTDRALRFDGELRGQVVLLDFWTYCCINCMHVAEELEHLEETFRDEPFIVIGVHSAKFEQEEDPANIRTAIQRFGMAHPVVVDRNMAIWRKYGVRAWPTLVLIAPDGTIVGGVSGEGNTEVLERAIRGVLDEAREAGTLAAAPLTIRGDGSVASASGLSFPGKVLADAAGERLFIADSGNNRVVEATWPDERGRSAVRRVYGGKEAGFVDGGAAEARFSEPQGMELSVDGRALFVADRRNDSIRAVDLESGEVRTIVGNGEKSYDRAGGKRGGAQGLNSPWDLELDGDTLYVAMAGAHQIWSVDMGTYKARALVGSGKESLIDDAFNAAALAQPSGLELVGSTLYFADSEVSAVRAARLDEKRVETIIGLGLFEFGDVDGKYPRAMLQHCLGVTAYGDGLLVADAYNDKIKLIDPEARTSETWLSAADDGPAMDEPGGLHLEGGTLFIADTNASRVLIVDPETRAWRELMLSGLREDGAAARFDFDGSARAEVGGGRVMVEIDPTPPEAGLAISPDAPASVVVRDGEGEILAQRTIGRPSAPLSVEFEPGGAGTYVVEARLAWCSKDGGGVCVPWAGRWRVDLGVRDGAETRLTIKNGS